MSAVRIDDLLKRYDGFVFDMDGTIVDSMPLHLAGWERASEIFNFHYNPDWFYNLGGVPSRKIAELIEKEQQISLDIDAVTRAKSEYFLTVIDRVTPFPAMKTLVHELAAHCPLAIGTGSIRKNAETMLQHAGLRQYFQTLTTADDVVHHKPNPDTFLLSAAKMDLKPSNCLVFEDTEIGLETAKNAGMDCVLIVNGEPDWNRYQVHRK